MAYRRPISSHATHHDYGALEQRVYNVEQGLQSIADGITSLSTKIDERAKTSWPTLASFATVIVVVMGALGTLALQPNNAAIARHDKDIAALQQYDRQQQASMIQALQHKIDILEHGNSLR